MTSRSGPYVGVTGFMRRDEVVAALAMVPKGASRRLMVGVLMSSKTLAGLENKYPNRYPKKDAVAGIFVDDERALNLVHYATDDPDTLYDQLEEVTALAGSSFDGFQLNIAWPPIEHIRKYRRAHPEKCLLLQIGSKAMEQSLSLRGFAEAAGAYSSLVDAALIDASGGKGEPLDPVRGAEYLRALSRSQGLGIGIAGGLGPDTLHLLDGLIGQFPALSIDAEGRLRSPKPEDALVLDAVGRYLEDAFPMLDGKELPGWIARDLPVLPYGLEEHTRRWYGSGVNALRTHRLAQPRALRVGDTLATGDKVLSPIRKGYNSSVWIHLTGGLHGHWVEVPPRIPIALLTEDD